MEEIAEENSFKSDAVSDSAFLSEGRQKRKSTAKSQSFDGSEKKGSLDNEIIMQRSNPARSSTFLNNDKKDDISQ